MTRKSDLKDGSRPHTGILQPHLESKTLLVFEKIFLAELVEQKQRAELIRLVFFFFLMEAKKEGQK